MDSLLLSERTIAGQDAVLAVVCDGVGSMEDGAVAASIAVKHLNVWFSGLTDAGRVGLRLRDAILDLNARIIDTARERSLSTASTLTALLFIGESYFLAHIGDSRAYSFTRMSADVAGGYEALPRPRAERLTVDDVSDSGKLTGGIGHGANPVLLCAEGGTDGRIFLICSDGLYKRQDIVPVVLAANIKRRRDITKLLRRLADAAIERGERDNISAAIVIQIN